MGSTRLPMSRDGPGIQFLAVEINPGDVIDFDGERQTVERVQVRRSEANRDEVVVRLITTHRWLELASNVLILCPERPPFTGTKARRQKK